MNLSHTNLSSTLTQATTRRPWDFGEVGLLVLLILGSIGNCLSICVMQNKRMRNTNAALFVTCMSISDTLLLLTKFIGNMIKLYRISIYNLCILNQIVPQAASFISVWLIMITTAERMIAVLRPLKVGIIFSKKRCKIIITSMIFLFIAVSSSISICISYSPTQPYYCQIKGSQNGTCFSYYTYIFPWIKSSFGSWLPSILGICFNLVIICELYRASYERETNLTQNHTNHNHQITKSRSNLDISKYNSNQMINSTTAPTSTPSHKKERQITIMLLTISISFVIFTLPYSTYELLRKLGVKFKWLKNRNIMRIVMLLMDLNHSTNFIFYCLTAQKFRKALMETFCSHCELTGAKKSKDAKYKNGFIVNNNKHQYQPTPLKNNYSNANRNNKKNYLTVD